MTAIHSPRWPGRRDPCWREKLYAEAAPALAAYVDGGDAELVAQWLAYGLRDGSNGVKFVVDEIAEGLGAADSPRLVFAYLAGPWTRKAGLADMYGELGTRLSQEVHRLESLLPDSGWPDPQEWRLGRV